MLEPRTNASILRSQGPLKDSQLIAIDDHDEALEKRLRLPLATTFSRAR